MDSPGKLIWQIACDEPGVDGAKFYGFGTLWMKWQRRGDLARDIEEIRKRHNHRDEIKWQKAHSKFIRNSTLSLLNTFFLSHG